MSVRKVFLKTDKFGVSLECRGGDSRVSSLGLTLRDFLLYTLTLRDILLYFEKPEHKKDTLAMQRVAACCSVLQHVAACCSASQGCRGYGLTSFSYKKDTLRSHRAGEAVQNVQKRTRGE